MGRATSPTGIVVLVAAAILVAGCGAASAPTPAPGTTAPVLASALPTYRPAGDVPAVLTATIDEVLCAEPAEKWCKYLKKVDGLYNIDARPGAITVQTTIPNTAAGKKLAADLCASLALLHFDENGTRLDYNHIHIFRGDTEQADCNAEDY